LPTGDFNTVFHGGDFNTAAAFASTIARARDVPRVESVSQSADYESFIASPLD